MVDTTPEDIVNAAYARSTKNTPGQIAAESTELTNLVVRAMRGVYAFSARINPTYFAALSTVSYDGADGWPRPEGAEAIFRIEQASDDAEVAVVPYDDRAAEKDMPSVWRFGQIFRPADPAPGPATSESLNMFYTKRPDDPGSFTGTLDPLWAEQFNELLVLEVAIYLAIKDGREGEIQALMPERDRWARRLGMHLEHETTMERRRHSHVRKINTNSLFPVGSMLAGGSSLDLGGGG